MAELIWVQPGRDDGRVALYEAHRDHPNGEAWVAGSPGDLGVPVQVALTPAVERKLASGDLVEVDAPAPPVKAKPKRKTKAEVDALVKAARGEAVNSEPPAPAVPKRASDKGPGGLPTKGKTT
jgi:hypothetical protein